MDAQEIVTRAEELTGLSAEAEASFWDGLERLVECANDSTVLTAGGRDSLRDIYVGELVNRIKVDDWFARNPALAAEPVVAPIFVCGIPRSGTTLLSYLLGQDPELRPLLNWEAVDSVPPPTTATLRTDPRAIAKARLKADQLAADPTRGRYHWEDADGPTECVFVHAQDFRGGFLESSLPQPAYTSWWTDTPGVMLSAYRYQKRVLQLLQSQAPGQWSLKAPSHAMFLDELTEVFPDAIILVTHRDPVAVVGSYCSLIRRNQSLYCDPVDTAYIGRNCLSQAVKHAGRPTEFRRRAGWNRVFDVSYANLVRDPIGEMERIYAHIGRPISQQAGRAMRTWLADHPQHKYGKHEYRHDEFGLTEAEIRAALGEYVETHQIEVER